MFNNHCKQRDIEMPFNNGKMNNCILIHGEWTAHSVIGIGDMLRKV
jgi:hypothetical protein